MKRKTTNAQTAGEKSLTLADIWGAASGAKKGSAWTAGARTRSGTKKRSVLFFPYDLARVILILLGMLFFGVAGWVLDRFARVIGVKLK